MLAFEPRKMTSLDDEQVMATSWVVSRGRQDAASTLFLLLPLGSLSAQFITPPRTWRKRMSASSIVVALPASL